MGVRSYADELRTKHSLDRRKMLQSDWYRQRWPKPAELTGDQNVKTLFTNSSSGQMFATTMLGAGTGLGGNCVVGETIVQTEIGPIRIDELVAIPHPPRVLSYNHQKPASWRSACRRPRKPSRAKSRCGLFDEKTELKEVTDP